MKSHKPYIKISETEIVELPIDASTFDGQLPSYYLNYDNLNNKPIINNKIMCYDTNANDIAGNWTVEIPGITELVEGLTIKVRLKTSYNSTTNTLNVNGLGAKTIWFRYGSKLTSHYAKESVISLTYTENTTSSASISDKTGWIIENIYDSTNIQQSRLYYTNHKVKSVLYRYMICFVDKDDLLIPANNVSNGYNNVSKVLTTDSFDIFKTIYYYNSTTTVALGDAVNNATLYIQTGPVDLRYSFNTGNTLIAKKSVYLVVIPQNDGQVKLAENPITQDLPITQTDYLYVYLGLAYDIYRIVFTPIHPIYVYGINGVQELKANSLEEIKNIKNICATTLDLSINNETYVINATLKNEFGDILSTKDIDLPLETMVVNGSYDNENKKVILTLKNGSIVEFSVADLIEGLQSEITITNKLNVNLIDGLSSVATSGDYNDLLNKPNIPTKTSNLINDNGFITYEEAPNGVLSCTYGVTTYQEIEEAILNGMMPIVYVDQTSTIRRFFRYNATYSGKHLFISVYDGNSENRSITVTTDNIWSINSVTNLVGSASETMITNRNNKSWGISTQNYDSAVRHALCDADGSTSYNPAYTEQQKSSARNKIGAISSNDLPTKLPNPYALTIANKTYDGSTNIVIQTNDISANKDSNGNIIIDTYATKNEVTTKLSEKSDISHIHDDRYYTESEIEEKLNNKSDISHNHPNYVDLTTEQSIDGKKVFNAPINASGEIVTTWFNTANGGRIGFGKEGPNSGTGIFFEQVKGTRRLNFRGSATAGAVVWEQPEEGAQLYIDLGKKNVDYKRITFPSSAGTLALTSAVDTKLNKSGDTMTGNLTIQAGKSINVNQYNDAGGVSLMNNGGGTATQFGSSTRPSRLFSNIQPEWYKNGELQGVLAIKNDIPTTLKNPFSLTFGSKTYDGSSPVTLTATDLGVLTNEGLKDFATITYVDTAISNLINSAPETLDTLGELAEALQNHEDAYGSLLEVVGNKVDKISGKGLSTVDFTDTNYVHTDNNYTTNEKNKLNSIEEGAQINTVTGIKGSAETNYRIGNISISKDNIGLGNVVNVESYSKTETDTKLSNKSNIGHNHDDRYYTESEINTKLNGKSDTTHTHGEATLTWGGKNISGSYAPIDAVLNPVLGANRLGGFKAGGITIEYSTDAGVNWNDYGLSDTAKVNLVTTSQTIRIVPSGINATSDSQLRITLDGVDGGLYTALNKMHIYLGTNYSNSCTVSMESYDYNNSTEWHKIITDQPVSGWSGWNILNFKLPGSASFGGTNSTTHQRKIRLTFKNSSVTSGKETQGLCIYKIYAYGGVGWTTPSILSLYGVPYTFDSSLNITTANGINSCNINPKLNNTYNLGTSSLKWATIYATNIYGKLFGNASFTNNTGTAPFTVSSTTMVTNLNADMLDGKHANSFVETANLSSASVNYANSSGKVINALTFGEKTYDGSTNQKITLADLGGQPIGNYANENESASSLDLSIDNSTYEITATLKNKAGTILSTKSIDLPLESVVVSGYYDKINKEVILTLKDNSTIKFSIADLVSGLQNEITDSNKLNVNLIDGLANVAISGSYNDLSNKPIIPTKISDLTNDSNFITNAITEIKVNGISKGTSGSVNLDNMVTYASSQTTTVAGVSKITYTYNQPKGDNDSSISNGSAYFPEGIIMGGTAQSAGLVTRGICGVTTPNATNGACSKENLYINYDGNNTNNPATRGVVINAGSSGTNLGNGVYSYCAVRGDAMKDWIENNYQIMTEQELNALWDEIFSS